MLASRTVAWVTAVLCTGLSKAGDGVYFLWALGVLPVLLFIGMSVLGLLTRRVAWFYAALWTGGCVWLVLASIRML